MDPDSLLWLLLHRLPGLTDSDLRKLQQRWPRASAIVARPPDQWRRLGIADAAVSAFEGWRRQSDSHPAMVQARRDMAWLETHDGSILWPGHRWWPPLLEEIARPPPLLYVQGDAGLLGSRQLAVVGSRRASRLGMDMAAKLASGLATAGFVITSGLAYGIDGAAHRAALAAGGGTLALLGNGLDIVYPRGHLELYRQIGCRGALATEFPLGTGPRPSHFPRRNRLISGLAAGVVVVEAALQSGSLITARLALEQNREVFAVPGSPANPQAQGCNALLRDGAALVECAADVLAGLGYWWQPPAETTVPDLAEPLRTVWAALADQLASLDALVIASGLAPATVAAALLELELLGLADQEGGGYRLGSG